MRCFCMLSVWVRASSVAKIILCSNLTVPILGFWERHLIASLPACGRNTL